MYLFPNEYLHIDNIKKEFGFSQYNEQRNSNKEINFTLPNIKKTHNHIGRIGSYIIKKDTEIPPIINYGNITKKINNQNYEIKKSINYEDSFKKTKYEKMR